MIVSGNLGMLEPNNRGVIMKLIRISIVLFLALVAGCAGMKAQERVSRLETAIQSYAGAIRWARYTDAYAYHMGKDGFRPPLNLEDYEGIRVTAYDIQEKTLGKDQMEATVVARISYYDDRSGVVNDVKHIQNWWFREEDKHWMLDASLPNFTP